MENLFIVIIFLFILWAIYEFSSFYVWDKKLNRIINIILFISLFILPEEFSPFILLILILRGLVWLFGPEQEREDINYYRRYKKAKEKEDIK